MTFSIRRSGRTALAALSVFAVAACEDPPEFTEPEERWRALGDGYRVEAKIVVPRR